MKTLHTTDGESYELHSQDSPFALKRSDGIITFIAIQIANQWRYMYLRDWQLHEGACTDYIWSEQIIADSLHHCVRACEELYGFEKGSILGHPC